MSMALRALSNITHLQCCRSECGARTKKGGEGLPLRLKLPHFFACMRLAWTIPLFAPCHSSCASSPTTSTRSDKTMPIKASINCDLLNINLYIQYIFFFLSRHFCNSPSVSHSAMRAARDVRLGRPLIKNPALDVTEDMHALAIGRRAVGSRAELLLPRQSTTRDEHS